MAILKVLTEYSYIATTSTGEKMGILVNYDAGMTERTGIEFFSPDGTFKFSTLAEFEELLGEKFIFEEIQIPEGSENSKTQKSLGDYPINDTDIMIDIQTCDELQIGTFRKSERSKKRFYPGWWILKSENGKYLPRLTLSVDIYNQRNGTDELYGPFKTYMDVTHTLKQIQ